MQNLPYYIDFHCHHPSLHGERAIQDGVDTWGIHPWKADIDPDALAQSNLPADHPDLVAIGECGLDKACSTPYPRQLAAFRRCIRLSEAHRLPLVLHCVRAADDILRLRREERATMPWVWHGFRGKPEQLRQLLPHGFWFSFGPHHHPESLSACPLPRLFLETDADETSDIRHLYLQASSLLHIPVATLSLQIQTNLTSLRRL